MIAACGVVYLLVGIIGFILPTVFGSILSGYSVFDNLLHLALGIHSLAVTFAERGTTATQG